MGIDFLDLTFHIEKRTRLYFDKKSIEHFVCAKEPHESTSKACFRTRVQNFDYRVGRFYELMRSHTHPICSKCRSKPLALTAPGICAACGESCLSSTLTWDQFCVALGAVVGKPAVEIREDQWLIDDLGFS